ncbi:hypothetical protein V7x_47860 [Crateriforma conspicua]|uniref:Uncharacterized protein n=1 Tax=Crateriforma conspicua TaxID=2527996 RepID=A0A5C6FR56_9PLAN|nr:hypothetical protein V7x_47860 [Crateriforma conspicua]
MSAGPTECGLSTGIEKKRWGASNISQARTPLLFEEARQRDPGDGSLTHSWPIYA